MLPCDRGVPLHDATSGNINFTLFPVSDTADFSHLTLNHFDFSAPIISPCQLSRPVSVPAVMMSAEGFRVEIHPNAIARPKTHLEQWIYRLKSVQMAQTYFHFKFRDSDIVQAALGNFACTKIPVGCSEGMNGFWGKLFVLKPDEDFSS